MSDKSKIEWTDASAKPVHVESVSGCTARLRTLPECRPARLLRGPRPGFRLPQGGRPRARIPLVGLLAMTANGRV